MKIEDIKPRGGLIQDRKPRSGAIKTIKAKMIKVNSSELGFQTETTTWSDPTKTWSDPTVYWGGIYGIYGEPPKMKGVIDF